MAARLVTEQGLSDDRLAENRVTLHPLVSRARYHSLCVKAERCWRGKTARLQ